MTGVQRVTCMTKAEKEKDSREEAFAMARSPGEDDCGGVTETEVDRAI